MNIDIINKDCLTGLKEINEIRRENKQKELDTKKLHTLSKMCDHFNYCTLLTLDDRVIHNAKSDGCNESFQDKNGNYCCD